VEFIYSFIFVILVHWYEEVGIMKIEVENE
jgi:hypothetical protein